MIQSIHLQNFESHEHTIINLDSKTNAIIGESEHGKSAILRAVSWVAFNRPISDQFRSKWGGITSVSLILDNGIEISREKSNKENCYWILKPNSKIKKLFGFGSGVPKEITEILGLLPLNFQTQFDPHYLLPPVSPGEVARKLNEIVDLEIIDKTQSNINSKIRETKRNLSAVALNIKLSSAEKEELSWVRDADIDLKELEKTESKLNKLRNREQQLNKILWEISNIQKEIKALDYIKEASNKFKTILKTLDKREKLLERINKLSSIIDSIDDLEYKISQAQKELETAEEYFKRKFPKICPLCNQEVKNASRK